MDAILNPLKAGMIILWSGSIASIPIGWTLCNGSNGTPDLRDRFVPGAGDAYSVDQTGGNASHDHELTDEHDHSIDTGGNSLIQDGDGYHTQTGQMESDIFTASTNVVPPFHALAYIMKL